MVLCDGGSGDRGGRIGRGRGHKRGAEETLVKTIGHHWLTSMSKTPCISTLPGAGKRGASHIMEVLESVPQTDGSV